MATSHSMTNNLPQLSHPDGSPIRALVVDDEPSLSELMSMGLRMAGWSVAVAADGPEAVKLAKEFRPDVLVLDVMLPGVDGVELLGRIRAFAPEVPALFLTAKDGVQDRILGLAAGGDDGSGRRVSCTRFWSTCFPTLANTPARGPRWSRECHGRPMVA